MIDKKRDFVCPECQHTELILFRHEKTCMTLHQVSHGTPNGWEFGKEEVVDCDASEIQCRNGHPLILQDGTLVQDLKALEQWFEERP